MFCQPSARIPEKGREAQKSNRLPSTRKMGVSPNGARERLPGKERQLADKPRGPSQSGCRTLSWDAAHAAELPSTTRVTASHLAGADVCLGKTDKIKSLLLKQHSDYLKILFHVCQQQSCLSSKKKKKTNFIFFLGVSYFSSNPALG